MQNADLTWSGAEAEEDCAGTFNEEGGAVGGCWHFYFFYFLAGRAEGGDREGVSGSKKCILTNSLECTYVTRRITTISQYCIFAEWYKIKNINTRCDTQTSSSSLGLKFLRSSS